MLVSIFWLLWFGAFSLRFRCLEGIQTRMLSSEAHSRFPANCGHWPSRFDRHLADVRGSGETERIWSQRGSRKIPWRGKGKPLLQLGCVAKID